jgi:hypothetical protein
MGAHYDTDASVPPSLVAFPYYTRIYFFRGDAAASATPRHIRYGSYTYSPTHCAGWSYPPGGDDDLTALFNESEDMIPDVVRTDRGVALAEYSRTPGVDRLRMAFVTYNAVPRTPCVQSTGTRELWYATLRESSPGVLDNEIGNYLAVPLKAVQGFVSSSAGGLAPHPAGYPLAHFWSVSSSPSGLLRTWRTYSD